MKMKKLLLMITLLATMPAALMAADLKLRVLYCEEQAMLYFVYNSTEYQTGSYTGGITELSGHNIDAVYYGTDKSFTTIFKAPDWYEVHDKVVTVVFHGNLAAEYRPTTTAKWFYQFSKLTTIKGIANLITINVTDMSNMFGGCTSLTSLNLSQSVTNFKTDNVTNMSGMFGGCSSLTSLNVSDFKTDNVTNMGGMFQNCSSLTSLNVSNFKTNNVWSMGGMFEGCSSLTSLNVSDFKTDNVKNMRSMFKDCSELTTLDLSNWNTIKVTDMYETFRGCSKLTLLDVSNWNTSMVTDMSWMFTGCSGLTSLDLSSFDTSKVTDMGNMFMGCSGLTSLDLSSFDTSNVTDMNGMFHYCLNLTSLVLDVSKFNTGNVKDMSRMFDLCKSLTSLDVSGFNTGNVTDMRSMFSDCYKLTSLDVSKWNTSNVKNMGFLFWYCPKLTPLDVSKWNTSNVTDMDHMFGNCISLTSLDVSGFNTSNVTNMRNMFSSVQTTSLYLKNFNTSKVTNMESMFQNCTGLTSIDVTGFDTSKVTNMKSMFQSCTGLTSIDVTGFDMRNVTNMDDMFLYCNGIKSYTLGPNFAKKNTASAEMMFSRSVSENPRGLRFIDLSQSTYSETDNVIEEVNRPKLHNMFNRLAPTTVIYLPTGSPIPSGDPQNVVYTKEGGLICEDYYSEDKVDIELPHTFKANKAQYSRTMIKNKYGTVILPYDFTSNDDIQCYTLTQEHTKTMYFEPTKTVRAHTPFLFEKKSSGYEASFIMEDKSGNYGITVNKTQDTELNGPVRFGFEVNTQETVASEIENTDVWAWWGYYVTEETSYEKIKNRWPGITKPSLYYIANNKFYHANGSVTVYPHRTLLLGNWNYSLNDDSNAPFLNIGILGADGEEKELTDIESAELFNTVNGIKAIYDVQGRRLQQMQPGLNIVHMEDGRILKVKK